MKIKINPEDIIGKRVYNLVISSYIGYDNDKKDHMYNCTCDCGNTRIASRHSLKHGDVRSCGCTWRDKYSIVGKRFGRLTVLEFSHIIKGNYVYKCECDCGNITYVRKSHLLNGYVVSCGCYKLENSRADIDDIIGENFGKLTVIEYDHYEQNGWRHWYKCRCECGNIVVVRRDLLTSHQVRSCGCSNGTHKMSKTRFYHTYIGMKQRCYNPNNDSYSNYGGRGIKVCDRWLGEDGFIHFKEDMYESYLKRAEECGGEQYISIDRIDVNGDYCKENCRWATDYEQNLNKRNTVYVSYNGEYLPLYEIIKKYADKRLPISSIYNRILVYGWDLDRALHELPAYHNGQKVVSPISFTEPHYICPISFRKGTDNAQQKSTVCS